MKEEKVCDFCTEMISFKIGALSRDITKFFNNQLAEYGITIGQVLVLTHLSENGVSSIKDIAQSLKLESSAISRLVDRLIKEELVLRDENKEDRRYMEIQLTEKGRALTEKVVMIPNDYNQFLKEKFGEEKFNILREYLEEISETLK